MYLGIQGKALLASTEPFEALLWSIEEQDRLYVAVKLPLNTEVNNFSLLFEDLKIGGVDKLQVTLRYSVISTTPLFPSKYDLTCQFDLLNEEHQSVLAKLMQVESVYIQYFVLGKKKKRHWIDEGIVPYTWGEEMRAQVRMLLQNTTLKDSQKAIVEAHLHSRTQLTREFDTRKLEEQDKSDNFSITQHVQRHMQRYELPKNWYVLLREVPQRVKLFHYVLKPHLLCLLVKLPPGTPIDEIELSVQSAFLQWCKSQEGTMFPAAGLKIVLRNKLQHYLLADLLFDLATEYDLLWQFAQVTTLDVFFVTDANTSKIIGAKQIVLSQDLKEQAKSVFGELNTIGSRLIWGWTQEAYYKLYPPMKSFQIPHNHVAEGQQITVRGQTFERLTASQEKFSKQPELPTKLPLIERCILKLRQADSNDKPSWSLLLAAGLEYARLFTWEKDALALLEQKRQTLHKNQRPVISPLFPTPYVWFEFAQPLETPICKDTAAMYLFSAASDILYRSAVFRSLSEPEFTQWKRKHVYGSEQERLSILIINTQGELVWSMSLPTTYDEGNKHEQRPRLTPPWYSCPQRRCKMFAEQQKDGTRGLYWELCPACKEAQIFFSTWVMTAWQALLGEYRTVPDREEVLDRIGTRQAEYKPVVEGYAWLHSGRVRTYTQLITYKDISQTLKSWHDVLHPRGSWVEALMKIDPELVTKKEQRVSEHTRRYTSPRFTNMQGQETIIPSFTRKSPVRPDLMNVPRKTDVVAKNSKENAKKRRK